MNSRMITAIILVIVILGGIFLYSSSARKNSVSNNTDTSENIVAAEGRVIFSVTDAAVNMSTISEIELTVSQVEMLSATGWVTVSTTPQTYSLLELNASGESKLLADTEVDAGTYQQIRLAVDKVVVKTKAGATEEAKLPSGQIKINTMVVVDADSTASVNLDFLADKSLHMTGNRDYIFAPVIKTEARSNANVNVDSENTVSFVGGKVDNENTVGMDVDGSVKLDFQIDAKQKLNIGTDNKIKIEGVLQ